MSDPMDNKIVIQLKSPTIQYIIIFNIVLIFLFITQVSKVGNLGNMSYFLTNFMGKNPLPNNTYKAYI